MELAKVVGQVVATARAPGLPSNSLLLVQFVNEKGEPYGDCHVAADPVGAGEGEWVLTVRGSSARCAIDRDAPLDLAVVGIVDSVSSSAGNLYRKT
ncbi:MAG: EutN/CcmL family microcompartment protein [Desulfovibrio sp.]|jgi:ethanolamine utilization protein EutN|nr:EutN/CcmL family microcompartment protein [Desulfovibrio sp.]